MYLITEKETISLRHTLPKNWVELNKELSFVSSAYYSKLPQSKTFPTTPFKFDFLNSRIIAFHGILEYMPSTHQVTVATGQAELESTKKSNRDNIILCVRKFEHGNSSSEELPESILGLLTLYLSTN